MSYQGKSVLAVIPARGGSKGIPRKNLKTVMGLSLVAHAARIVSQIDWLDAAVLSTDDPTIADEGRRHGLAVPFMRPAELSNDSSSSIEMWRHAWLTTEATNRREYDISVLLEPTSPLRCSTDVVRTVDALLKADCDAAATVSRTSGHYTPHKTLEINATGEIVFFLSNGANYAIRQKIPAYYHRNGICYAVKRSTLIKGRRVIEKRCRAVVIKRPVVNIDDLLDLEIAEMLMQRQKRQFDHH